MANYEVTNAKSQGSDPLDRAECRAAETAKSVEDAFRMVLRLRQSILLKNFELGAILDLHGWGNLLNIDETCLTEFSLEKPEVDELIALHRAMASDAIRWNDLKKLSPYQLKMFVQMAAHGSLDSDDLGAIANMFGKTNSAKRCAPKIRVTF